MQEPVPSFPPSTGALAVFCLLTGAILGMAWYWRVRGRIVGEPSLGDVQTGSGLAVAWFLGVCGLIAFYGYDGLLCAIGLMAGGVLSLLVGADWLKPTSRPGARGAAPFPVPAQRTMWAVATVVVGMVVLIPQMVAAGALLRPFLPDVHVGPWTAGPVAVAAAGTVVLAWVPLDGAMPAAWMRYLQVALIVSCVALACGVCARGLAARPAEGFGRILSTQEFRGQLAATDAILPNTGAWESLPFARVQHADGSIAVWRFAGMQRLQLEWAAGTFTKCQLLTVTPEGRMLVNNLPQSRANGLRSAGAVLRLADGQATTGALGPLAFPAAVHAADLGLPRTQTVVDAAGRHTVCYGVATSGADVLLPGNHPTLFPGIREHAIGDKLNLVSLMVALVCGVAALRSLLAWGASPVDTARARRAPAVDVIIAGMFSLLAFYLGLGALIGGVLDPTDSNLAWPLLARSFGAVVLALMAALAFCLVIGGAAALIRAVGQVLGQPLREDTAAQENAREEKFIVLVVGVCAILLGILFQKMNVALLLAWGLGIASSAVVPLAAMRFWKGATWQGCVAAMVAGLLSSVSWILLSTDVCANVYGLAVVRSLVPFNQPAIVTMPVALLTLVVVSLITGRTHNGTSVMPRESPI